MAGLNIPNRPGPDTAMPDELRPLKIVGCGGHGRVIADIARAAGVTFAGFIDDRPAAIDPRLVVEGPLADVLDQYVSTHSFAVGIGDGQQRWRIAHHILDAGGTLATLVHPTAIIAPDVSIGEGTVIMAGAIVNTGSSIGRLAIINTGAIVDHDNTIEDNVQIAPGCSLAGTVTCRRNAFIGTGATIIPRIVIGEGAYVAAGATVIRDVRAHTMVAGCPAVEMRSI